MRKTISYTQEHYSYHQICFDGTGKQEKTAYINPLSGATDNITELLTKIVVFTKMRQKILIRNINNVDNPDFVPMDLAIKEFSLLLNVAIDEYSRSRRLLLKDSENIKFGKSGSFEVTAAVDKYAQKLFTENRNEYIEAQLNKLMENSLNQRIASELLKQKQRIPSVPD